MAEDMEISKSRGEASWPTLDDPDWANASAQTREWLQATQPEVLAVRLTDTIERAFHTVSDLVTFAGSFPEAALQNAIDQLPSERAKLFKEQLDFVIGFSEERHAARETKDHLGDHLFALTMKAIDVRNTSEHPAG